MASLDNLVITNALPVISRELGAGIEELQWVMNSFSLLTAVYIANDVRRVYSRISEQCSLKV